MIGYKKTPYRISFPLLQGSRYTALRMQKIADYLVQRGGDDLGAKARRILQIFFMVITLFLIVYPLKISALGITPGKIVIPDILVNSAIEKKLIFTRGVHEKDTEDIIRITISDEIAPYIQTPYGKDITFKKGSTQFSYPIIISTNDLAPGKEYTGTIRIAADSLTELFKGQSIPGVEITISFSTTDKEINKLTISGAHLEKNIKSGMLDVFFVVQNKGNVQAKPEKIHVILREYATQKPLSTTIISLNNIAPSPAYSDSPMIIPTDIAVHEGNYRTVLEFFDKNNRVIHMSPEQHLEIINPPLNIPYVELLIPLGLALIGLCVWKLRMASNKA